MTRTLCLGLERQMMMMMMIFWVILQHLLVEAGLEVEGAAQQLKQQAEAAEATEADQT